MVSININNPLSFGYLRAVENKYMQRCFQLARMGLGFVAPNPLVGCVIVNKNRIIGEGYHHQYGGPHAEVFAIRSVSDPELLKHSTLYVSLEPCAHHGKTPPCAELIVESGIPKVVIANRDPFEAVNGKGIEKLQLAGIEVVSGVCEEEGSRMNRRFFTFHNKKRPYVILKAVQSQDGFMDPPRNEDEKGIRWISAHETAILTHQWRAEESAILIGTRTAQVDNPSLTTRQVSGPNPLRLLIDKNCSVPADAALFSQDAQTVVFNAKKSGSESHVQWVKLDFAQSVVPQIMDWCHQHHIQSVLVEGGAATLQGFLDSECWDEARLISGNVRFGKGLPTPSIKGKSVRRYTFGGDRIEHIIPQ
ncbi:MAG: bifunctional diaminohydroxyphosphoribosylaminopyrimidine deaminase/5-amino-6-(5-phosphoribosylamino)uracil reductase RibD [Cryomorphaceae bacterium]|nr:MAG: bifunctional diaminohydroxyphosphoribosylaminopyrimidine deaminase/5-amino-6-(5-phosphoribosylamino)uracil reductase RibD [Cryomorphaceae bacterium]